MNFRLSSALDNPENHESCQSRRVIVRTGPARRKVRARVIRKTHKEFIVGDPLVDYPPTLRREYRSAYDIK